MATAGARRATFTSNKTFQVTESPYLRSSAVLSGIFWEQALLLALGKGSISAFQSQSDRAKFGVSRNSITIIISV